ncbi:hypothetical protein, partial [Polaribacter atrinae]|uniref:hypothetical protein n=1 Tax=Polaribacter atrinae TaxID=1333662 RepID=UPI000A4D5D15
MSDSFIKTYLLENNFNFLYKKETGSSFYSKITIPKSKNNKIEYRIEVIISVSNKVTISVVSEKKDSLCHFLVCKCYTVNNITELKFLFENSQDLDDTILKS